VKQLYRPGDRQAATALAMKKGRRSDEPGQVKLTLLLTLLQLKYDGPF
jgi:hypothetical protein